MNLHDPMCPSPHPQLIEAKNCAYCLLIERIHESLKGKKKVAAKVTAYEEGFRDGYKKAIDILVEGQTHDLEL